jgi:hypothetical protein
MGVFQQAIDKGAGGKGFARAGSHLNQGFGAVLFNRLLKNRSKFEFIFSSN